MSLYALGVAIGGPVIAAFASRYSRKLLLLIYVAIFTVGYVYCALAPNYASLLVVSAEKRGLLNSTRWSRRTV